MQSHSLENAVVGYNDRQYCFTVFRFVFLDLNFIYKLLYDSPSNSTCQEFLNSIQQSLNTDSDSDKLYEEFKKIIERNLLAYEVKEINRAAKELFDFLLLYSKLQHTLSRIAQHEYITKDPAKKSIQRQMLYKELRIEAITKIPQNNMKLVIAINFLCQNIHFFEAPFVHPNFQVWANAHVDSIRSFSNKMINILQHHRDYGANKVYELRLNKFKNALEDYVLNNDINNIKNFLTNNPKMVKFLAHYASDKKMNLCINNWYQTLPDYQQKHRNKYIFIENLNNHNNYSDKRNFNNSHHFYQLIDKKHKTKNDCLRENQHKFK